MIINKYSEKFNTMHSPLDIKNRLQDLIINKETDYAKSIYENPVKEYIDPKRAMNEKKIIFEEICGIDNDKDEGSRKVDGKNSIVDPPFECYL